MLTAAGSTAKLQDAVELKCSDFWRRSDAPVWIGGGSVTSERELETYVTTAVARAWRLALATGEGLELEWLRAKLTGNIAEGLQWHSYKTTPPHHNSTHSITKQDLTFFYYHSPFLIQTDKQAFTKWFIMSFVW